ncbi:hypothetical protein PHET_00120 [Paragonimus heterotremus]|uniref:C2H2-type domain-containing protein n=1 Tax=Paragonimus heterotremus TaxID=100268 RepID=A0A8J4SU65_9TREM|nr:hypothetical protein PHET_00120 [Paragonimus heterotremus]
MKTEPNGINGNQTNSFLAVPVACSTVQRPQTNNPNRTTFSPDSKHTSDELQHSPIQKINANSMKTDEIAEPQLSFADCSTGQHNSGSSSPNQKGRLVLSDLAPLSPHSDVPSAANVLPCPCGLRFSDATRFIGHARQCSEFARTAVSFAEAAAAVVSSTSTEWTEEKPLPSLATISTRVDGDIKMDSSSSSTEDNTVRSSSGIHLALDLSVRTTDLNMGQCIAEIHPLICSECKFMGTTRLQMYEHFESIHAIDGNFTCKCGETYNWLSKLLKHQLNCSRRYGELSDSVSHSTSKVTQTNRQNDIDEVREHTILTTKSPDWLPGTHAVSAPRHLSCTGCGKIGFPTPTDLLNHFSNCTQMSPHFSQSTLSRKPSSCDPAKRPRALPYSSVLNGMASQTNSWKSPPTCPVLTPSETSPMSFTSKRPEVGVTVTPRFPLGFLPPIGLASMNKTQSYSSSLGPYFSTNMTYSLNPTQTTMSPTHGKLNHRSPLPKLVEPKCTVGMKESGMEAHPSTTDLSRPFKCCHCIKAFKSKALLDQHMHIHYPPKYTCRYCAKKYRWPPVFYHHQRTCKKRPPATTADANPDNHTATITMTNARTLGAHASDLSFSFPPGSTAHFFANPSTHPNASTSTGTLNKSVASSPSPFPSIPPPYAFNSDMFFAPHLTDISLPVAASATAPSVQYYGPESMGIAALAAAMGMRLPFPSIPPPLGLTNPYNSTTGFGSVMTPTHVPGNNVTHQFAPNSTFLNTGFFPPFLTPHSNLVTPTILNQNTMLHTTVSSAHDSQQFYHQSPTASIKNSSSQPEMQQCQSSTNQLPCVCGQRFNELPAYLHHLTNCTGLQKIASIGSDKKSDTMSTIHNIFSPGLLPFPFLLGPNSDDLKFGMEKTAKRSESTLEPMRSKPESTTAITPTTHKTQPNSDTDLSVANLFSSAMTAAIHAVMQRKFFNQEPKPDQLDNSSEGAEDRLSQSTSRIWNEFMGPVDSTHRLNSKPSSINFPDLQYISDKLDGEKKNTVNQNDSSKDSDDDSRCDRQPKMETESSGFESQEKIGQPPADSSVAKNVLFSHIPHSTEQLENTYPREIITSSGSLMAVMATALANAAAAAGFQCPGLVETSCDSSEYPPASPSISNGTATPKSCSQCGKEFSSRLSLKQHVEGKHSTEGKYQCPGCAKRYRWGASYYYHKKSCPAIRENSPNPEDTNRPLLTQEDNSSSTPDGSPSVYTQNREEEIGSVPFLSQHRLVNEHFLFSLQPEFGSPKGTLTGHSTEPDRYPEVMGMDVDTNKQCIKMTEGEWPTGSVVSHSTESLLDIRTIPMTQDKLDNGTRVSQ